MFWSYFHIILCTYVVDRSSKEFVDITLSTTNWLSYRPEAFEERSNSYKEIPLDLHHTNYNVFIDEQTEQESLDLTSNTTCILKKSYEINQSNQVYRDINHIECKKKFGFNNSVSYPTIKTEHVYTNPQNKNIFLESQHLPIDVMEKEPSKNIPYPLYSNLNCNCDIDECTNTTYSNSENIYECIYENCVFQKCKNAFHSVCGFFYYLYQYITT